MAALHTLGTHLRLQWVMSSNNVDTLSVFARNLAGR
jgi:hypothetical protein